ncbi:hypothetical protein OEZ86_003192 [Tetradesmus obliquus]|nr:hypothetical protein OEZ86_003192 [Tetradesmus obliquus]
MADKAPYLKALGGFQVVPATQRVAPVWVFVPSQLCGINVVSCIADTQARQRAAGAALHELQQVLTAAAGVVLAAVGPNGSGAADAEVLLSSASCSAQVTAASELARLQAKLSGLLQQTGLEQDKAAAAAAALRSSGSSNAGDLQQTRQQLVEVRQVKLCLEKVQDEIEDLEYALKKAVKKQPAKVPVLCRATQAPPWVDQESPPAHPA